MELKGEMGAPDLENRSRMCTAMFVTILDCVYMHTLTRLVLHQSDAIYTMNCTDANEFFHKVLQKQ